MLGCQIISTPSISGDRFRPLGRELVIVAKDVREAIDAALARAGGSLGIWIVLNAVSNEGLASHSLLASREHVDGATITYHVDRAEKLGLVRREVDPDDRRVKRLHLTPKGSRLHERLLAAALAFEAEMCAGIGEKEKTALRRTLAKIRVNLAPSPR
jgi:MarR family transcriptional regulator, transcriptional regulator for hemolysin